MPLNKKTTPIRDGFLTLKNIIKANNVMSYCVMILVFQFQSDEKKNII